MKSSFPSVIPRDLASYIIAFLASSRESLLFYSYSRMFSASVDRSFGNFLMFSIIASYIYVNRARAARHAALFLSAYPPKPATTRAQVIFIPYRSRSQSERRAGSRTLSGGDNLRNPAAFE